MSQSQLYVLDANVFIEAARRYYAFDLVPAFWNHLERLAVARQICSVDAVREELEEGKDQLGEWIKTSGFKEAFVSTDDAEVIEAYREIISWVQNSTQFFDAAKQKFADDADGWVVAYAKAKGSVVVTQEEYRPDVRKRVPIPNICREFDVQSINMFDMLRTLGVRIG